MEHIRPLNALRFVAAFLIFLSHLDFFMNIPGTATFFQKYVFHGYSGVTIFFVLSGFLLTYRYYPVFLKRLTPHAFRSYYWKRLSRMYPIHIVTLIAAILVLPLGRWTPPELVANIFLVQAFIPLKEFYFGFNDVSWFLSALFFCYLVLPLILLLFTKTQIKLSRAAGLLFLGILVYTAVYYLMYASTSAIHWPFYISPYQRLIEFVTGMFFGIIYFLLPANTKRSIWLDTFLEALVISLFVYWIANAQGIDLKIRYSLYFIPIAGLIVFVFSHTQGFFARALSSRVFQWLGSLSFAFMMIHHIIIRYLEVFFMGEVRQKPFSAALFMFLASVLITLLYQNVAGYIPRALGFLRGKLLKSRQADK